MSSYIDSAKFLDHVDIRIGKFPVYENSRIGQALAGGLKMGSELKAEYMKAEDLYQKGLNDLSAGRMKPHIVEWRERERDKYKDWMDRISGMTDHLSMIPEEVAVFADGLERGLSYKHIWAICAPLSDYVNTSIPIDRIGLFPLWASQTEWDAGKIPISDLFGIAAHFEVQPFEHMPWKK